MGLVIGIDTGGTFTDMVVFDPATGHVDSLKTSSTPSTPGRAIVNALGEGGVDAAAIDRGRRRLGILLHRANHSDQEERHRGGERRVLRIEEHVAVIERASREQDERDQTGGPAGDPPRQAPRRDEAAKPDQGADQTARLEQPERRDFAGESGEHCAGDKDEDLVLVHVHAHALGAGLGGRKRAQRAASIQGPFR